MNIESISSYKEFIFFDTLTKIKKNNSNLYKIEMLLNIVLAFFPIIDENQLIEYFTFLGFKLNRSLDFELISNLVTIYVAAGGIMVENCNDPSLVQSINSEIYQNAFNDQELRNKFNRMHDEISGEDILE